MKASRILIGTLWLWAAGVSADPAALLEQWRSGGAGPFSAARGEALWRKEWPAPDGRGTRSCTTCHGGDPRQEGRHVRTRKRIAPMAHSANAERFRDPAKVEKWFRRNCRWVLGRECTAQEKGDVIRYLMTQ